MRAGSSIVLTLLLEELGVGHQIFTGGHRVLSLLLALPFLALLGQGLGLVGGAGYLGIIGGTLVVVVVKVVGR